MLAYYGRKLDSLVHGRQSFQRFILAEYETSADAYKHEALIVSEAFIKLADNYNLTPGGRGGGGNLVKHLSFEERSRRWKKALLKHTPITRKLAGVRAGNTMKGRSKSTHEYLVRIGEKIKEHHNRVEVKARFSELRRELWREHRERYLAARMQGAMKTRGRTKLNHAGRRKQAEALAGRVRPDISARLSGLTKETCEWRSKQAESLREHMLELPAEVKAQRAKHMRSLMLGDRNPMYGLVGELAPMSKYTDAQRQQVRDLFDSGVTKRRKLAELTGVEYQTVKHLIQAHLRVNNT